MSDEGGRGWAWAAIGCAAFLLLGFCVATGAAGYLVLSGIGSRQPEREPTKPQWVGNPTVPDKPGATGATHSLRVTAEVVSVTGAAPAAVGETCSFEIEERPRSGGGTWCHSEIACGGRVVYGGGQSGYYPCAFSGSSVRGRDDETTRDDGDASLLVDTEARTLTIADDVAGPHGAFGLEARITRTN